MTGHLSRQEFSAVKTSGKNYRTQDFSIILCLGTGKSAVVTSAKLDKRAVVRNLLRRRIRASVTNFKTLDMIIFPQKTMLNWKYAEISAHLNSFLSKILSQSA